MPSDSTWNGAQFSTGYLVYYLAAFRIGEGNGPAIVLPVTGLSAAE
jgi:hypothetical protein